jgi:2,5-diketo-D-gluconate reductase A
MNRRNFLKIGTTTAAALVLPVKLNHLFGKLTEAKIPLLLLNNGVKMPQIGFGTLYLSDETGERCVAEAIACGYRLLDTAAIYGNEQAVGAGIKKSGIAREKLFITSKVWVDDHGFDKTLKAFDTALNKIGSDYLDLYLIHRPRGDVKGTWQALEQLYQKGKIKAIGVSNFTPQQIKELMDYAKVKPAVNQIETHAFLQQKETSEFLKQQNIQTEAWSPLVQGRNGHFTNPVLAEIGKKYNKNNAQVSLRWHLQRGIVAIPRTSQREHMIENLQIFDFELSGKDMQTIAQLDLNITQFPEWE